MKNVLNTIKSTIKHNFFAKFMSLVAAVVLWLFVMENQNPTIERDFTLPIEVANAANDYDYTLSKKNVRIKIAAKRMYFATLDTEKMRATIDLSSSGISGSFDAPIVTELPKGYESVVKSEDKVNVTLDPYIIVPVMVDIKERGSSQDIAKVSAVQKTEPMLEIRGTAKNTAKVNKLIGYVDLIGKEADFEQEVILIPVDNAGSEVPGVEMMTPTTFVKVKMKKSIITKTVAVTPIITDKNAQYKLTATPAYIEIRGEDHLLDNINEIQTEAVNATEGNIQAKLIFPENVTSKINSVTINIKR